MSKRARMIYAIAFGVLLLTEVAIALFVHDDFIRPYFGDVLVTILLCCLCSAIIPQKIRGLAIYVFIFAALVEVAQYFNIVGLLGLENNTLLSTIIGTSFSVIDILCYGVGCLAFWAVEKASVSVLKHRRQNDR